MAGQCILKRRALDCVTAGGAAERESQRVTGTKALRRELHVLVGENCDTVKSKFPSFLEIFMKFPFINDVSRLEALVISKIYHPRRKDFIYIFGLGECAITRGSSYVLVCVTSFAMTENPGVQRMMKNLLPQKKN